MSEAVSIIVPVHGRAHLTERCLDALLSTLPEECEVIVVDDASPDATQALLASYGEAIRALTLAENVGYARACNAGAALAAHELLLFLNNDIEPLSGWLQALCRYAQCHPAADVLGAKLLYPTGCVQHAGVVIGQDGYPHNLYAGLPANHPAVDHSRALQAVTGACMLVRRAAFERVGGFDEQYLNSLEDVDLCLRVGENGGEVRYCHDAVLVHLESASRGRHERFERSVQRYRERWRELVRRDDLATYAEDGLLEVEYSDCYPVRLSVSPRLAVVEAGRESEIESLLHAYAGQVRDLLAEVVRLSAISGVELSPRLHYRGLVRRIRETIAQQVPEGSSVLVISRGDRELLELRGHTALHFPQDPSGRYLGHHPADSEEAIARLEQLRASGAEYLVLPSTSSWWLEHYAGFAEHLRQRYSVNDFDACSIYELRANSEQAEKAAS